MVKKCILIMLIMSALGGIIVFFTCSGQNVRCVTGINNLGHYYILEFEKMNREDSYMLPVCKDDVFDVNFRIDKGHADLIIGIDGKTPIYKGNDIEAGAFEVIASESGEYRIIVNAKHASGFVEINAKRGVAANSDD